MYQAISIKARQMYKGNRIDNSTTRFDWLTSRLLKKVLLCASSSIGLAIAVRLIIASGFEWRLPAMAVLAFGLSTFKIEINSRDDSRSLSVPLWHSVLFAGAVTLGWPGAVLPGAFFGAARLMFGEREPKHFTYYLYAILKPAIACVLAALTYTATGGDILRPQAVDAIFPILAAGVVYAACFMILKDESIKAEGNRRRSIIAWSLSLLAGYCLAVINSAAPAYVLLVPLLAVGMVRFALWEPEKRVEVVEENQPPVETSEPARVQEDNPFVDPGTGLANEKYLDMFLKREISRAERNGGSISAAVFDLDNTKKLTESFGKGFIDEALAVIGMRLKNSLRDYDLVVRHSPRRVLVVLPETGAEEAYAVTDRLHQFAIAEPHNGITLSTSVGIATYPDDANTQNELIQACHRALNQGRFTGPNRVHGLRRLEKAG